MIELSRGVYVDRDVLNISEKVQEYDEKLRIKYCEPSLAEPGDPPWKLVEICRDGIERVVFDIWDLNDTVLERIHAADTAKGDILHLVDGTNHRVRQQSTQRYEEKMDEANDIITSMLKSPKHKWTHKDSETGRIVTFDDREKFTKIENA